MFVFRMQLLWKSSLQRHYPPSTLCRLPSQLLRRLPSFLSFAGSYSIPRRSRLIEGASSCLAYSPSQCVARCRLRPREWRLSLVLQKSGRCSEPAMPSRFSPFGRVSPSTSPSAHPSLAATAPVACVNSQRFGHSNLPFEATYRIQLLSLHLATFPPPATPAAGLGYGRLTILTRRASHPLDGEPYPGSQLNAPQKSTLPGPTQITGSCWKKSGRNSW